MTRPSDQTALIVVGSLHYDIMLEVSARPRPGETLKGQRWYPKFGGKGGNQAVAAAQSGVTTRFVGAVGQDNFADFLLAGLKNAGISTQYVVSCPEHGSGMSVATKQQDGEYSAIVVSGANLHIDPTLFEQAALWDNVKLLILQNEVSEAVNLLAAERAKALGVRVCLNAAPSRSLSDALLRSIDILVVNAIEAEDMSGVRVNTLNDAQMAAKKLSELGMTIIVTAGSQGLAVCSFEEEFTLKAVPVKLISTHGAGDMFVGTLCAHLAKDVSLKEAAMFANQAAARHVSGQ